MQKAERANSLEGVLEQSQRVMSLLQECASGLASANTAIRQELAKEQTSPEVGHQLMKSEAVQHNVQEACERLSVVNEGLEAQLRDRTLLDHRFAAALEQEEAARHAALHDALTDLPNRALFRDRLEHGLAQARRHGWKLAVLFMDLDHFKDINDLHGHQAGDCVLQNVARRLLESIRGEDTVSRYGGDEFLYVLTDIEDEKWVALIAEKIIENVQAPYQIGLQGLDSSLSVRASIGIAVFPKDGATADALVKSADAAMYRAKQSGLSYAFA